MRPIHIAVIVFIGVAIAYVVSLYGSSTEYVSFPDAEQLAKKHPGKTYHVVTTLNKAMPMVYDPQDNPNLFTFYAKDTLGNQRLVVYKSAKPQNFEHSERVVLEGHAEEGHFEATKILSKCPSKYQQEIKAEEK